MASSPSHARAAKLPDYIGGFFCGGGFSYADLEQLPEPPLGLLDLFGSRENFGLVHGAQFIALSALRRERTQRSTPPVYTEVATVALAPADIAAVRALLTSDDAYVWDRWARWDTDYFFRLTLRRPGKAIVVEMSPSVRWLRVLEGERVVNTIDFAFGREAMRTIVTRYFPGTVDDDEG